jgi:hypothetical protein
MRRAFLIFVLSICCLPAFSAWAISEDPLFFFYDPYQDPLARRDDYGLLHQSPQLNQTDLAPRHALRLSYYFKSGEELVSDPAYVGALQVSLRTYGYYCGPVDGVFSNRVSDAIARLQKNYSLQVTGTLTVGVRRALHLP